MNRGLGVIAVAVATVAVLAFDSSVSAHRTAASPYTFHRDVLPILDARCGRCHTDGSPSGVALTRYASARGAIWPIRQMLISGHMPPWFAEGAFKSPAPVTARELNILMTWATGGAPEGAPVWRPVPPTPSWPLGPPDLIVPMPSAFTFTGGEDDHVHEVRLPSPKFGGRMVRAVDLLPGTPAIVRSAEIIARSGGGDRVLGLWQPGELPASLEGNAAFRVPANASIVLRIRYRRHYGDPAEDLSRIGFYFAKAGAAAISELSFDADSLRPTTRALTKRVRAVALRPVAGPPGARVRLTVIGPDNSRKELALLQLQGDWNRRYVFKTPVILAAGDKIEVSVLSSETNLWNSLTGIPAGPENPVRVILEFVN
jgi:hypothetical protein